MCLLYLFSRSCQFTPVLFCLPECTSAAVLLRLPSQFFREYILSSSPFYIFLLPLPAYLCYFYPVTGASTCGVGGIRSGAACSTRSSTGSRTRNQEAHLTALRGCPDVRSSREAWSSACSSVCSFLFFFYKSGGEPPGS